MIGRLTGALVEKNPPEIMIDVGGVGYELEAPLSTCYKLPAIGAQVSLLTHLAIREDAHVLYGFGTSAERLLFRNLIKVSGVGAKLALLILSGMSVEGFAACVQRGDTDALVKLPGIGKKTAERLLVEMRDRIAKLDLGGVSMSTGELPGMSAKVEDAREEAISALTALGYKVQEASRMVRAVKEEGLSSEAIIRKALQSSVSG